MSDVVTAAPPRVWRRRGVCERCGRTLSDVAWIAAPYSVTGAILICRDCIHAVLHIVGWSSTEVP